MTVKLFMIKKQNNSSFFIRHSSLENGFTLIELLVSVAVIAMMSAITVKGFIGARQSGELVMEAQKVVSDVRRAEGYALALKSFGGNFSNASSTSVAWGVHFQKNNVDYEVFADVNNNGVYESGETFQSLTMSAGIKVSEIYSGGSGNDLSVVFIPPDPKINITRSLSVATATIEIANANGAKKYIYLNRFGLVDVVNATSTVNDSARRFEVVLNEATGKDCDDICDQPPRDSSWDCADAGLSSVYNGGVDKYKRIQSGSCDDSNAGGSPIARCGRTMGQGAVYCDDYKTEWIYCYCKKN